jgi:hypothetical protein
MDQTKSWLGTESPERGEQGLTIATIPYEPQFGAGDMSSLDKEHVWVDACVPWSNCRGAAVVNRHRIGVTGAGAANPRGPGWA